jgi:hypothetical protein
MQKYLEYLKNPRIAGAVGLLAGLIIGMVILGWGLFPVQWEDAAPSHLRTDYKLDYLRMAVLTFIEDDNEEMALLRWKALGEEAPGLLAELKMDGSVPQDSLADFENQLGLTAGEAAAMEEAVLPEEAADAREGSEAGEGPNWLVILLILCLSAVIIGGALVYVLFLRNRQTRVRKPTATRPADEVAPVEQPFETEEMETVDTAVGRFTTTYVAGDDIYDDSYSIDSQSGEFLGECGVTISETLNTDEPKKVNAFEIWLFDKNDIQTVTKVLLSEHSFNDSTFRQRMLSKGEPILVQPGSEILLETATLQLEAHVVDLQYGISALPQNSHFERLSIELSVWPKK